jgi:4-amino-4-deoxy-L-arabinose transferase-like glycosyltransferase
MNDWLKKLAQFPTQFLLIAIGALLFFPHLGDVHLFDWDEINFAESAREMLLTHNYRHVQINFHPFYEKPPLFIWLQALSMHYFGVSEYAARLPNAICGIITMIVVFNIGRFIYNSRFGVMWALLFAASILPHLYFKSGIIDPVFNLFIFSGIYLLFRITMSNDFEDRKTRSRVRWFNLITSGVLIGLAILTKGPVAFLVTVLVVFVYFTINRGKVRIEIGDLLIWTVVICLVIAAWLSYEVKQNGIQFIDEFIKYQIRLFKTEDAGHGGPFYYHFIVLLIGCFPASALIFESFKKNDHDDNFQTAFKGWMIILLCVVLVIFSIVKTKIVHYSSLCYFPITYLAAYYVHQLWEGRTKWSWKQMVPFSILLVVITAGVTFGLIFMSHPKAVDKYVHLSDPFGQEALNAAVYWGKYDWTLAIVYFVAMIIGVILMYMRHIKWGIYVVLIASAVFVNTMMVLIVPRVEKYSQAALIEFLQQRAGEDCYISVLGFKSYAIYYYADKQPPAEPRKDDNIKVIWEPTDKPVYLIVKINMSENIKTLPMFTELYRKNGFIFLKKKE